MIYGHVLQRLSLKDTSMTCDMSFQRIDFVHSEAHDQDPEVEVSLNAFLPGKLWESRIIVLSGAIIRHIT